LFAADRAAGRRRIRVIFTTRDDRVRCRNRDKQNKKYRKHQPLHAHPGPFLHVFEHEMHESPHAHPVLQILQQPDGAEELAAAASGIDR
jgi:hypothetical protein